MYAQCYQNTAAASREAAELLPERHHASWATSIINLVQQRNRQKRTQNFRKQ
jgi:hypothetical protein